MFFLISLILFLDVKHLYNRHLSSHSCIPSCITNPDTTPMNQRQSLHLQQGPHRVVFWTQWKHMGIMYKLWYVMWVPSLTQYLTNFTQDATSSVSCVLVYSSLGRSDLAGLVPKQILKYFPTSFPFVPSHLQQVPASFMSSGSYTGQFIYQITTQHDEYVVKTKGMS